MKFFNATAFLVLSLFATSNVHSSMVGLRITSDVSNTVCTESETQMIEQSLQSHLQDIKNNMALRTTAVEEPTCTAPCATLPSDQLCLSVDPGCNTKKVANFHKALENPPANLEDYCVAACEDLDGVACEMQYPACAAIVAASSGQDVVTHRELQRQSYQCPTWYCGSYCSSFGCACKEIITCCWDWAVRRYCDDDDWRRERVLLADERQLAHSPDAFLSDCHAQQQAAVNFLQDAFANQSVVVSDECRAALQETSVDCIEL